MTESSTSVAPTIITQRILAFIDHGVFDLDSLQEINRSQHVRDAVAASADLQPVKGKRFDEVSGRSAVVRLHECLACVGVHMVGGQESVIDRAQLDLIREAVKQNRAFDEDRQVTVPRSLDPTDAAIVFFRTRIEGLLRSRIFSSEAVETASKALNNYRNQLRQTADDTISYEAATTYFQVRLAPKPSFAVQIALDAADGIDVRDLTNEAHAYLCHTVLESMGLDEKSSFRLFGGHAAWNGFKRCIGEDTMNAVVRSDRVIK